MNKIASKTIFVCTVLLILVVSVLIVSALFHYYDPNRTILSGWNAGTGSYTYVEISKGTRQPDIPDTSTYVAANSNQNQLSEFGFPNITDPNIVRMTLWVYTSTGSNAQYTFSLRQGTTTVCSNTISSGTAAVWQSCTWNNPSGDFSDMRIYLHSVTRDGGGAPTPATVYAAYLEVLENLHPNVTMLHHPADDSLINTTPVDFNFTATDDLNSTLANCTLIGNFSGSWLPVQTIYDVQNNTMTNITFSPDDGYYHWNVECFDHYGLSASYESNYSFRLDTTPPNVTLISPEDDIVITDTNEIIFTYNVTDDSEILECNLYINNSINGSGSGPVDRGVPLTFTRALDNDAYTWRVDCLDEAGHIGSSETFNFNVSVYHPEITSVFLPSIVNLNPGSTKLVECNVSVEDGNGFEDIAGVNATFYLQGESPGSPDNNVSHYTNNSCEQISGFGDTAEYTCSFNVYYYASNGTWYCNATAVDNQGLTGNEYNTTLVDELYALKLSALSLSYGEVPAGELSEEESLSVFNIGNQMINVYVRGYGGSNPVSGEGLAMICDDSSTIDVENQRFSLVQGTLFENMNQLSSTFQYSGMSVQNQVSPSEVYEDIYWRLQTPPSQVTNCDGTIVFSVTG